MLVTRRPDGTIAPFDPLGVDTLEKPCYDFKGLSANLPYLRELVRAMEAWAGSPMRRTTRTVRRSSSSTGSTRTR